MKDWVKRNKLASFLLLVIVFYLFTRFSRNYVGMGSFGMPTIGSPMLESYSQSRSAPPDMAVGKFMPPSADYAPQPDVKDRLVVSESDLSLLVKDVVDVKAKILTRIQQNGGYMVSATISNPQDAPTSAIIIRVPSVKLDETLAFFRSLAIKVVSENLMGHDVTDEYVDVEKRIDILETTKARFETILSQAQEISDITNLSQQIINIQAQIDALKGSQEGLKQRAQLAKVTLYLSTDEIALPYAPSETFRPEVIFKLAVRSLVGHLRQIATLLIWVVVYSVFWVPALFIIRFLYRRMHSH